MPRRPSEPSETAASRRRRLLALVACGLLFASSAAAAPPAAPKHTTRAASDEEAGLPNITFTGFRRLSDGRALVYVELTRKVPLSVIKQPSGIVYRLEGARVALKNNKNPLLTGAFATNLLSARLVPSKAPRRGKGRAKDAARYVDVVLNLRAGVTPTHVMSERSGGAVLEITIPAPSAANG